MQLWEKGMINLVAFITGAISGRNFRREKWNCLGDCIGHSGGGTGFRTHAEWYLSSNKGLFIFSNKYNESVAPGGDCSLVGNNFVFCGGNDKEHPC